MDSPSSTLTPSASSTALAYLAAAADFPSNLSSSGVSSKGSESDRTGSESNGNTTVSNVISAASEVEGSLFVCTRISGGKVLSPARRTKVRSFVRGVAALEGGICTACIAVEFDVATAGSLYSDVKTEAEAEMEAIKGRRSGEDDVGSRVHWGRNLVHVGTEHAFRLTLDAPRTPLEQMRLVVLPVTQWGITTALNACVHVAAEAGAERIAFQSLEISVPTAAMSRLVHECSLNDTLVAGAALPGHAWGARSRVKCDGLTCPWNTLAVWNMMLLSGVGFLAVGNGKNAVLEGTEAGMEEVSTVSVIQSMRLAARQPAKVKLARVDSVVWDTSFLDDAARRVKHQSKMASKVRRAEQHLAALDVEPATIIHC